MSALVLSLLLGFFCNTYAAGKTAPKPAAKPAPKAAVVPPLNLCIFGGQSGKPFGDLASFKSVIWKSDVIYAGGAAGQLKDQEARLEILKALREARSSKIAVGFEAVNIPLQPVLDDYAAGKISEEEFLQKTGWQTSSGVNFSFYKPIFTFIIQNKLRALALGIPRETIFKLEREGAAALNEDEKKMLPETASVIKHKKYLDYLKTSYAGFGAAAAAGAPLSWNNYLAAVSSWNEGAGAKIAGFVNANPGWSVLVTTSNDRIIYNAALPSSVKSRTVKLRQASFYFEDAAKCPETLSADHKDLANYVWYINHPKPLPAVPTSPSPAAEPGKKI